MRKPWTRDELDRMLGTVRDGLNATEADYPEARALPPLSEDETRKLMNGLLNIATERPLTDDEVFIFGQLLAQYRMSVEARMLGRKNGRYYVISEADVARLGEIA